MLAVLTTLAACLLSNGLLLLFLGNYVAGAVVTGLALVLILVIYIKIRKEI